MYKREIVVPAPNVEPYRRPTPSYQPTPVRRRRRRRRINFRPLLFLVSLCVMAALSLKLASSIAAPETALPETAVSADLGDSAGDWRLTLVNPWNPLPEDYTFTIKQLSNGQSVDKRCYEDLQDMMDNCREAGLSPLICSS
ncbi:MAG: hypothetical protein K2O18_17310, partial [Oscillospiraceae bacterium]|nr:hypothetical protein [Oscillospiraceae bacterium]